MSSSLEPQRPLVSTQSIAPAGWGGPSARLGDDEEGVDWGRYVSALARHRLLIFGIVAVGSLLGFVVRQRVPQQYTVSSTIWLQAESGSSTPLRSTAVLDGLGWLQLLRSNRVLDSVAMQERLYVDFVPADSGTFASFRVRPGHRTGAFELRLSKQKNSWELASSDGLVLDRATAGTPIGTSLGFDWIAPARLDGPHAFHVATVGDATNELRSGLRANLTDERGSFLNISLSGEDPVRSARTLNLITERFVTVAAELKRRKLTETSHALEEQLAQTESRLRSAEGSLEKYKTRIITLPTERTSLAGGVTSTQQTVLTEYFRQKMEVEDVRRDREALERLQAAGPASLTSDAILRIPAAGASTSLRASLSALGLAEGELRDLGLRYTDQARQVATARERVETLRREVTTNVAVLVGALQSAERDLRSRIGDASRDLAQIPNRVITEQRLSRDVDALASIYVTAQASYQASKLAEASSVPDVGVLDAASVPTVPDQSVANKVFIMIVGASFGFALVLALLLDRLDKRFRYPAQVTGDLGLAILGVVPPINRNGRGAEDADGTMQVVESFRSIRLALLHAAGEDQQPCFTVTSPGPGDGKSLVSSNLALSFAEAGYSTLLVDGDIRRGELHKMFSCHRQPGLLDVLAGHTHASTAVRPTSHSRLHLLPCGTRLSRGPELLGSPAMRELLTSLRTSYQVIIFDSPPLGAGIDPLLLAAASGAVVLVLRAGETDRHLAEAKLQTMDRMPVRPLGAILNDVRTSGAYKYYSYVYGYAVEPELGSLPPGQAED